MRNINEQHTSKESKTKKNANSSHKNMVNIVFTEDLIEECLMYSIEK